MQKSSIVGDATAKDEQAYEGVAERVLGPLQLGRLEASTVVSIGLTLAAVLLIGSSLATAQLRLDDYGLAGSLWIGYAVGVALLPLASGVLLAGDRRLVPLLVFEVVVFVLAIWLTPLALEGTPRFRTSYVSFGFLDPLLRGQGLIPTQVIYHNWPLFPIAMAGIVRVLDVPGLTLMAWFPVLIMLAYLPPLAGLLRIATEPATEPTASEEDVPADPPVAASGAGDAAVAYDRGRQASGRTGRWQARRVRTVAGSIRRQVTSPLAWVAGLWFFLVFDWTGQDYFSPQALAYLLFLCWAYVLADVALRHGGRFGLGSTALALAIFTAITLTHVLTAMLALGALIALTVFRQLRRPTLVVTCGLIFFTWNVYAAAPFYRFYSDQVVSTLLALGDFLTQNVTNRVNGTPEHEHVALIRILATVVAFALGGLALLVTRLREGHWPRDARFAIAFVIGIAVVAPISAYGGEMLIRTLLFSLPIVAFVVVRALDSRVVRWSLIAALVVMGPLQLITHYGNERYDYVSPGELAGYRVIDQELAPANIYGGFPGGDFQNVAHLDWRNAVVPSPKQPLSLAAFESPQNHHWVHPSWPIYVVLDRGDAAAGEIFYRQADVVDQVRTLLRTSPKYKLVYSNADISIYRWLGPPPAPGA